MQLKRQMRRLGEWPEEGDSMRLGSWPSSVHEAILKSRVIFNNLDAALERFFLLRFDFVRRAWLSRRPLNDLLLTFRRVSLCLKYVCRLCRAWSALSSRSIASGAKLIGTAAVASSAHTSRLANLLLAD